MGLGLGLGKGAHNSTTRCEGWDCRQRRRTASTRTRRRCFRLGVSSAPSGLLICGLDRPPGRRHGGISRLTNRPEDDLPGTVSDNAKYRHVPLLRVRAIVSNLRLKDNILRPGRGIPQGNPRDSPPKRSNGDPSSVRPESDRSQGIPHRNESAVLLPGKPQGFPTV